MRKAKALNSPPKPKKAKQEVGKGVVKTRALDLVPKPVLLLLTM